MVGRLEMYVGGMFAEKSTNLIRQGKRHLLAGRKVIFIKPKIDGRYSDDAIVTHDGVEHKAINIDTSNSIQELKNTSEVVNAEVVCIDEIQFFDEEMIRGIDSLIHKGKIVYVSGLDMDRFGNPFGIVPHLMAVAEKVTKVHAVCTYCGNDAWISLDVSEEGGSEQVVITSEFVPSCRSCAAKQKTL